MGNKTGIPFCTATVNFWHGCLKISPGCKYCYMYREKQGRFGNDASKVERASKQKFNEALKWKEPQTIFTCSWSDFYIKQADEWRPEAWDVIRRTPHHFWIIITKRPERIVQNLPADWGKGWPNVIHLVSAEKQHNLDVRIKHLLEVKGLRGLILEPLLEPINIAPVLQIQLTPTEVVYPLHWVIMGGESGNDNGEWLYRNCRKEWLHEIVKQCKTAQVPVFVKQLGTALAKTLAFAKGDRHGENMDDPAFPMYLKVQEFPESWAYAPKGNDELNKDKG